MRKPDPLLIQAVNEAAESLIDLLQVIHLESHALSQRSKLDEEAAARAARIAASARTAIDLSRLLLGDGNKRQSGPTPSRTLE